VAGKALLDAIVIKDGARRLAMRAKPKCDVEDTRRATCIAKETIRRGLRVANSHLKSSPVGHPQSNVALIN
jgi:hypothetical protein